MSTTAPKKAKRSLTQHEFVELVDLLRAKVTLQERFDKGEIRLVTLAAELDVSQSSLRGALDFLKIRYGREASDKRGEAREAKRAAKHFGPELALLKVQVAFLAKELAVELPTSIE